MAAGPSAGPPVTGNPTSYRIDYARYVAGRATETRTVGSGANRRKALRSARIVRSVVRPFDETGDVNRSLGFIREAGAADSRVALVRPIPDDPRPLVYPPPTDPSSRALVIAGRDCQTFRDGDETYCVDATGLVLMTQTKNSVEIATKVTTGDRVKTAAELTASLAKGFTDVSRGSIRPIHPDSAPPGTDWSLDAPPPGFALVGRYAVAPLTGEVLKRDSRKVIAGIVDVYVRGADALVVERGGKLDTSAVEDKDLGSLDDRAAVDLGALGAGEVGIGGIGPFGYREVRALPSQGRYVVVAGTLPADELVALTRSLRSWPGTTIRYLDR